MPQNPNPFSSLLPSAHQNLSFHLQRAQESIENLAKGLRTGPSINPSKTPKMKPNPKFQFPFAHQNLSFHIQRAKDSVINLFKRGPSLERREDDKERVLISEVLIRNKDGEVMERRDLEEVAASAIKSCRPNSALTLRDVHEDAHRIVESGLFWSCIPVVADTRDGINLVFQVEPSQDFRGLICEGANVLPAKFLENAFRDRYGKAVNRRHLNEAIRSINGWYTDRGLCGSVSGVEILSGGILGLQVAETEVNDVKIRFLDRKTKEPTVGMTKQETLLRELATKKGQVYSFVQGKIDEQAILAMGIMKDVSIEPQPAGDTNKVDLVLNLVERRPRDGFSARDGTSCGITYDPRSGLMGSCRYSHENVFGRNKKFDLSVDKGLVDSHFRINYTDPWIEGDNKRTSRSIMIQNSKTPGTLGHGNQEGGVTIRRVSGGIEFSRPLRPNLRGTVGLLFQRAGARDHIGAPIVKDFYNTPLTASGKTHDDMLIAKLGSIYTCSSDRGSSMLALDMEQGLPILPEWLCFSRATARARQGVEIGPAQLILSLSGGHVAGSFPPHEAFAIGGTNSVRGYEEGAVGSGRSYAVGSGELSFPLCGPVQGVVFADYGSYLGSGPTVPGDPAGSRGKPGTGYGYGLGLCVNSPLGPLRLEYALNDRNAGRFHFGIGHRN